MESWKPELAMIFNCIILKEKSCTFFKLQTLIPAIDLMTSILGIFRRYTWLFVHDTWKANNISHHSNSGQGNPTEHIKDVAWNIHEWLNQSHTSEPLWILLVLGQLQIKSRTLVNITVSSNNIMQPVLYTNAKRHTFMLCHCIVSTSLRYHMDAHTNNFLY